MSKRYEMQTSSAGSTYWIECKTPLDQHVSRWHKCAEIPDEVIERWERANAEAHAVWRQQQQFMSKQQKHRSTVVEQLADLYAKAEQ